MKALKLPGTVPCPACDTPLGRVFVAPVAEGDTLKAVRVTCVYCGAAYDVSAEEMARGVAHKAALLLWPRL